MPTGINGLISRGVYWCVWLVNWLSTNIEKGCVYSIAYGTRQNFNRCSTSTGYFFFHLSQKNIYLFLTKLLMWWTGLKHTYFNRHSNSTKQRLILTTILVVHGTCKNAHRYYTATEKKIVYSYSATMVHGTRKLLSVIVLMFNEKHINSIWKAYGCEKLGPNVIKSF